MTCRCNWQPTLQLKLVWIWISHQYKYGFSRSMLTELMGSSRNHVVNVKPFSYGHFASGGSTIPWKEMQITQNQHKINTYFGGRAFCTFAAFKVVIERQKQSSVSDNKRQMTFSSNATLRLSAVHDWNFIFISAKVPFTNCNRKTSFVVQYTVFFHHLLTFIQVFFPFYGNPCSKLISTSFLFLFKRQKSYFLLSKLLNFVSIIIICDKYAFWVGLWRTILENDPSTLADFINNNFL